MFTPEQIDEALANWRATAKCLSKADEDSTKQLLDHERNGKSRPLFLNKIYGRYSKLRAERERRELLNGK